MEGVGFTKQSSGQNGYAVAQATLKLKKDILSEVEHLFSDLLSSGILEKLRAVNEEKNLFSQWLNESLIDSLKAEDSKRFNPADAIAT